MPLNTKEKELVAVGASVAAGCKPCTSYHFKKVRDAGMSSDDEIIEAISDAMCVRNSAKEIMEAHGLEQLGIRKSGDDCGCGEKTTRIKELVSMAAAFAVNCTSNLGEHITAARSVGISDDEIGSVLDVTLFVKEKAASHVNRIAEVFVSGTSSVENTENPGGCCCDDDSEATTTESNKEAGMKSAAAEEDDCGCGGGC